MRNTGAKQILVKSSFARLLPLVSKAADSQQVLWMGGVLLDLSAQPPHIHREGIVVHEVSVSVPEHIQ